MPRGESFINDILHIFDLLLNFFHNFSGGKRGHKGGRRHFTDPNALKMAKEKEEKEKEWRRARGEVIGKKCLTQDLK